MKLDDVFGSKYLKAEDLKGHEVEVTIDGCQLEEFDQDGRTVKKLVLNFVGKDRGLVLNKTNANRIGEMHGDETDNWGGKRIKLFPDRVDFAGNIVDAIRVKIETAPPEAVDDEDLPF